jgi:hypothetical protein
MRLLTSAASEYTNSHFPMLSRSHPSWYRTLHAQHTRPRSKAMASESLLHRLPRYSLALSLPSPPRPTPSHSVPPPPSGVFPPNPVPRAAIVGSQMREPSSATRAESARAQTAQSARPPRPLSKLGCAAAVRGLRLLRERQWRGKGMWARVCISMGLWMSRGR